jgi:hypothetical protein
MSLMSNIVAGAVVLPGECGKDDITSANLDQMAATLETRPPTDEDRRELVEMLRSLARMVREMEASSPNMSPPTTPVDDPPPPPTTTTTTTTAVVRDCQKWTPALPGTDTPPPSSNEG